MPLVVPIKTLESLSEIQNPDDYKKEVFRRLEGIEIEVFANRLLVVVYVQYARSKVGGLILPTEYLKEDLWQGRAALVVKLGKCAFVDDAHTSFYGQNVHIGDWVSFRVQKSTPVEIAQLPCRIVEDRDIELKHSDPRHVTGSVASTDVSGRTYDLPDRKMRS
jgi:Chaperonin 10 Kd subunit